MARRNSSRLLSASSNLFITPCDSNSIRIPFVPVGPLRSTNCLIKKVLERVFVASNKKVLEIIETYHHWQQPGGGKDEADDATAAGLVAKTASRYQRSSKKEKGSILSELVEVTEYSRVYARRVLRQHGQRIKQGKHSLLADVRVHSPRRRAPYYDEQVRTGHSLL
jgi:hypothetical protein